MKHRVFVITALLVLIGAAFLAREHHISAGGARTSSTGTTITLTENGFTPEELTIRAGDTVKFVSTTGDFFWPASNPHPTHTIYPAFDPQKPIAPDSSWSFTFTEAGTWHYHDHLAPYFTGTITVVPS